MSQNDPDLVIVGGGLAGLVAGARAVELGLSVTILEQGDGADYPCNTRWSGGVFHIAYNDITKPTEELRAVIESNTDGLADAEQAATLTANGSRFIEWLKSHGSTFVQTAVDWQQFILSPMREMRAGLDWQNRGPDQLMRRLTAFIEAGGGSLVLNAHASSLLISNERCVGVSAFVSGSPREFKAGAVLLADGGFQANIEQLGRHIAVQPDQVKQRGAATGCGTGLAMAQEAGADTVGLDHFYGHLLSRDAFGNDNVWPYPEVDALASAGILVGGDGRRFTDEGHGGIAMTNALARHAEPLSATIIFDQAIWDGPGRSARIPANPTLIEAGGTVLSANGIEELATLANLPSNDLAASIDSYNTALRSNRTATLNPPRTATKNKPWPIIEPPFYALPVCPGITYTMGGVSVDRHCRVLTPNGAPIPGLFAAGSTTGGLEGWGDHIAYAGGLAKAGIQGLAAAEEIARQRQDAASRTSAS